VDALEENRRKRPCRIPEKGYAAPSAAGQGRRRKIGDGQLDERLEAVPEKDYSAVALTSKLGAKPGAEVTVFFTTRADELRRRFPKLKRTLGPQDGLWVAWPKKASRIETDLTFAEVQRIGLENGLVDNKSASVDEAWQAVRFVYRSADRRATT
jgi:hypothetical protein